MNKIEGGPECDYTYLTRLTTVYCDKGYFRVSIGALGSIPLFGKKKYCSKCHGTGVKPLSEWTADECAEWLKVYPDGYIMSDPFDVDWDDFNKLWFIFGGRIPSYPGNDITKGRKTFTEALRAAVAAAAKERECSK